MLLAGPICHDCLQLLTTTAHVIAFSILLNMLFSFDLSLLWLLSLKDQFLLSSEKYCPVLWGHTERMSPLLLRLM